MTKKEQLIQLIKLSKKKKKKKKEKNEKRWYLVSQQHYHEKGFKFLN